MKSLLKFLVTSIGLVLILIGVFVIVIGARFDQNLKSGIEQSLSFIYQTTVTIEDLRFQPSQLALEIDGLAIQNPEPFKEGTAMWFGSVQTEVDPASIFTTTPTIRRIIIHDAHIKLRYEPLSGTNLGKLADNAARLKTPVETKAPAGAGRKFTVKEFRCEGAKLGFSSNIVPVSEVEFDLEPITLNDLDGSKPVSTADMCVIFARSVLREGISVRGILKPAAEAISRELQRLRGESGAPATPAPTQAAS